MLSCGLKRSKPHPPCAETMNALCVWHKPKGVCQTHNAFIVSAQGGCGFDRLSPHDSILSYLPMAWVGDHLFSYAQWLVAGFSINCPESGEKVMTRMEDASAIKRWLFRYFTAVARRCGPDILDGKPVGAWDRLQYALGNLLVYGPLRN